VGDSEPANQTAAFSWAYKYETHMGAMVILIAVDVNGNPIPLKRQGFFYL